MCETVVGIKCEGCGKVVEEDEFGLADTFNPDTGEEKPIYCPFCGTELIGNFKEIGVV